MSFEQSTFEKQKRDAANDQSFREQHETEEQKAAKEAVEMKKWRAERKAEKHEKHKAPTLKDEKGNEIEIEHF